MIGLVGGLGIGAGIHHHRELAAAHAARSLPFELALVHADLATVARLFGDADRAKRARYLAGILRQLKAAGATVGVIPAVTPHMCVAELTPISPVPLVNMIDVVAAAVSARRLTRVALFGTRFVVESDLFGKLLAGTDLAVLFDESNTHFPHLDCARAHIQAIMRA